MNMNKNDIYKIYLKYNKRSLFSKLVFNGVISNSKFDSIFNKVKELYEVMGISYDDNIIYDEIFKMMAKNIDIYTKVSNLLEYLRYKENKDLILVNGITSVTEMINYIYKYQTNKELLFPDKLYLLFIKNKNIGKYIDNHLISNNGIGIDEFLENINSYSLEDLKKYINIPYEYLLIYSQDELNNIDLMEKDIKYGLADVMRVDYRTKKQYYIKNKDKFRNIFNLLENDTLEKIDEVSFYLDNYLESIRYRIINNEKLNEEEKKQYIDYLKKPVNYLELEKLKMDINIDDVKFLDDLNNSINGDKLLEFIKDNDNFSNKLADIELEYEVLIRKDIINNMKNVSEIKKTIKYNDEDVLYIDEPDDLKSFLIHRYGDISGIYSRDYNIFSKQYHFTSYVFFKYLEDVYKNYSDEELKEMIEKYRIFSLEELRKEKMAIDRNDKYIPDKDGFFKLFFKKDYDDIKKIMKDYKIKYNSSLMNQLVSFSNDFLSKIDSIKNNEMVSFIYDMRFILENDADTHICTSLLRVNSIGEYRNKKCLVFDHKYVSEEDILINSSLNNNSNQGIVSFNNVNRSSTSNIRSIISEKNDYHNEIDLIREDIEPSGIMFFYDGGNSGLEEAYLDAKKNGIPLIVVDYEEIVSKMKEYLSDSMEKENIDGFRKR